MYVLLVLLVGLASGATVDLLQLVAKIKLQTCIYWLVYTGIYCLYYIVVIIPYLNNHKVSP